MKKICIFLFMFILGCFLIPYNTKALSNEVLTCNYNYKNQNGKTVELEYKIYSDGEIKLPFTEKEDFLNDGRSWYHGEEFSNIYYSISKISNKTLTCPSIYVQENNLGVTVYPNPIYKDSCTGYCYNISSSAPKLSSWAKKENIKSKRIISSCIGSNMGFYNRKNYIFPYFRLYTDGTKEWSIDGKMYVPVTNAITGTINSEERFSITVNDSLLDSIFSTTKASCPSQIYRCVSKIRNGYSYELSTSANACSKDEFSTADGQEFGSLSYGAAFGDPSDENNQNSDNESNYNIPGSVTIDDLREDLNNYDADADCNSLLGDVKDPESVAWLLQQVLNYIKILGPILVVILSSVDFAKAIMASDDENMKKAEKKLMIRLVLAIALFLIPTLVSVLLNIFGITTDGLCNLE